MVDEEGNIKDINLHGTGDDAHPIKVSMDSYKDVDGLNFPFKISISNPAGSISVKYEGIELNQDISDDLFNPPQLQGEEEAAPSVER